MTHDPVDELIDQLEDEGSVDLHPAPEIDAEDQLDDEDLECLLYDCNEFLEDVLEKARSKWMAEGARVLLGRLERVLAWHRLQ